MRCERQQVGTRHGAQLPVDTETLDDYRALQGGLFAVVLNVRSPAPLLKGRRLAELSRQEPVVPDSGATAAYEPEEDDRDRPFPGSQSRPNASVLGYSGSFILRRNAFQRGSPCSLFRNGSRFTNATPGSRC